MWTSQEKVWDPWSRGAAENRRGSLTPADLCVEPPARCFTSTLEAHDITTRVCFHLLSLETQIQHREDPLLFPPSVCHEMSVVHTFNAVLRNLMHKFICRVDDSGNEIMLLSIIKFITTDTGPSCGDTGTAVSV